MTEEFARQQTVSEIALGLRRWCRGETDRRLTARLTAVAVEIALQSSLRGRIYTAAAAEDAAPADIALSLLARLFVGTGSESHLAVALQDLIDGDDAAIYSLFRRVVWTVVRQELFHRWPLSDPLAFRVWRQLRRAIRVDNRIMSFPADRPRWIAPVKINRSAELILLDDAEVLQIVSEIFRPGLKIADLAAAVVAHQACQNRVVPIDILFGILRESVAKGLADILEDDSSSPSPDPHFVLALEKAISEVRPSLAAAVNAYIVKGTLSPETADGFLKALLDLVTDLGDGWPGIGHFNYVHVHCPAMTYEDYRNTYRSIFEYLAEKSEGWFFDGMRKYYYEK